MKGLQPKQLDEIIETLLRYHYSDEDLKKFWGIIFYVSFPKFGNNLKRCKKYTYTLKLQGRGRIPLRSRTFMA